MHVYLVSKKPLFEATLDHFHKELGALRTGRATPALVEDVRVNAYDSVMELKGLASISIQDAKTIIIDPWDKGMTQAIEKAIRDAGIGLSPVADGTTIRIMMPPMTEENRIKLVKLMKERTEDTRIALRGVREQVRDEILEREKAKDVSEDEKFKLLDELEKLVKEYNVAISGMAENKETEIMTV